MEEEEEKSQVQDREWGTRGQKETILQCIKLHFNFLQTGQWTGTVARICKSSLLTDEEICKKKTCIQHCCPHTEFLESATNECKSAELPLTDTGEPGEDYQYNEFVEWFGDWKNETHKKVRL